MPYLGEVRMHDHSMAVLHRHERKKREKGIIATSGIGMRKTGTFSIRISSSIMRRHCFRMIVGNESNHVIRSPCEFMKKRRGIDREGGGSEERETSR